MLKAEQIHVIIKASFPTRATEITQCSIVMYQHTFLVGIEDEEHFLLLC